MTWRERLAVLLGAASPFAIAGEGLAAPLITPRAGERQDTVTAIQPLEFWSDPAQADRLLQLAGHSSHRSHSSHSSHSSHRSHVSGSGTSTHYSSTPAYTPPAAAPAPAPTPPARLYAPARPPAAAIGSPRARSPAAPSSRSTGVVAPVAAERLGQDEIIKFVQRVQIALIIKGYDPGPADGVLSSKTMDALRAFQAAGGLTATGAMDKDTLNALGVLK